MKLFQNLFNSTLKHAFQKINRRAGINLMNAKLSKIIIDKQKNTFNKLKKKIFCNQNMEGNRNTKGNFDNIFCERYTPKSKKRRLKKLESAKNFIQDNQLVKRSYPVDLIGNQSQRKIYQEKKTYQVKKVEQEQLRKNELKGVSYLKKGNQQNFKSNQQQMNLIVQTQSQILLQTFTEPRQQKSQNRSKEQSPFKKSLKPLEDQTHQDIFKEFEIAQTKQKQSIRQQPFTSKQLEYREIKITRKIKRWGKQNITKNGRNEENVSQKFGQCNFRRRQFLLSWVRKILDYQIYDSRITFEIERPSHIFFGELRKRRRRKPKDPEDLGAIKPLFSKCYVSREPIKQQVEQLNVDLLKKQKVVVNPFFRI